MFLTPLDGWKHENIQYLQYGNAENLILVVLKTDNNEQLTGLKPGLFKYRRTGWLILSSHQHHLKY